MQELVQNERAVMKEEIKKLKTGSRSTVGSEASTGVGLGSGTCARSPPLSARWTDTDPKKTGIQGVDHRFHTKEHSGDYKLSKKKKTSWMILGPKVD